METTGTGFNMITASVMKELTNITRMFLFLKFDVKIV